MCNFNQQSDETKTFTHLLITKYAQSVGGANFLLGLVEAIKEKKPNALIDSSCKVDSKELKISWNKIIFKDKFDVLEDVLRSYKGDEGESFNILNNESQKKKKKILTMIKTLAPLEFRVIIKGAEGGEAFDFKIFEMTSEDNVSINPFFAAIFFCSTEVFKKALNYKA